MNEYFLDKSIRKEIPIPYYYQLKEILLDFIRSQTPYTSVPTETLLCTHFELSRSTVRQALSELSTEGYIERHKGKGTMTLPRKIEQDFLEVLESFNDEMQQKGLIPTTSVEILRISNPTIKVREALSIREDDQVVHLQRLRGIEGDPVVLVDTYIPIRNDTLKGLIEEDFVHKSLYYVMKYGYKIYIESSKRVLEIRFSNEKDSALLKIKQSSPIQYIETISYDDIGLPVEFSCARYRSDKSKFVIKVIKKNI